MILVNFSRYFPQETASTAKKTVNQEVEKVKKELA